MDDDTLAWPTTVDECDGLIQSLIHVGGDVKTHLWTPTTGCYPTLGKTEDHLDLKNHEKMQQFFDIGLLMGELTLHCLDLRFAGEEDKTAIRQHLLGLDLDRSDLVGCINMPSQTYRALRCFQINVLERSMASDYKMQYGDDYNGELANPFYEEGTVQSEWRESYNAFCAKLKPYLPTRADCTTEDAGETKSLTRQASHYHQQYQPDTPEKRASFKHLR